MIEKVIQAFVDTCSGYSSDRVVADPELNAKFLLRAKELGVLAEGTEVNLLLLNARKAGALTGMPRSRRTTFQDTEDYAFASEIAIRHLERTRGLTLDRILCDPALAREFDCLAEGLAPGYTPLKYRWAALQLRKMRRLQPELLVRIIVPEGGAIRRVGDLSLGDIPISQGLYIFYDSEGRSELYVGEASNLRKRLSKHLDHSDNRELARHIWGKGTDSLWVQFFVLPQETDTRVRRALELDFITRLSPVFNVKGI